MTGAQGSAFMRVPAQMGSWAARHSSDLSTNIALTKTYVHTLTRLRGALGLASNIGDAGRSLSTDAAAKLEDEPKSLFVFNLEGKRYNAPLLIGLMEFFLRRYPKVGFFQPVAGLPFPHSTSGLPRHVELLRSAFSANEEGHPMQQFAVTREECVDMIAHGQTDQLMQRVDEAFQAYVPRFSFTIAEGTHQDGPVGVPGDRLLLNARLASIMGAPVLLALDMRPDASFADHANFAAIARDTVDEAGGDVLGVVLNHVPAEGVEETIGKMQAAMEPAGIRCFGGLPQSDTLHRVRLDAVAAGCDTYLLAGQDLMLDSSYSDVLVAADRLEDVLQAVEASPGRPLVVTPASRPDVVLGLAAAQAAGGGPHPAGILITDSGKLEGGVRRILEAGHRAKVFRAPVLEAPASLMESLHSIQGLRAADVLPTSAAKIEHSKTLFTRHVDGEGLAAAIDAPPATARQTPRAFMHALQRRAQSDMKRIVLPEGTEPRVLKAAADITRRGLAYITLLGNPDAVQDEAAKLGVDVSACTVVDPMTSPELPRYIDLLVEARKHKGTTSQQAADMLQDVNYFGTLQVAAGDADGLVSGSVHTTAATIRPALQVLRSKEQPLVSSCFFMCLPEQVLVFGDCAVNLNPDAEGLAHIAIASADTAAAFGVEPPRVALLSYSTGSSGSGDEVQKVREAADIAKELRPDLFVEGPLQYDAAVDPSVAATKVKGHTEVAGQANVLVFPNLNSGNVAYKAVQQSSGAIAMGPIMQGLRLPVNDLSRGCTVPDIINTVMCTAVQAQAARR
mmetsp:Transcript_4754/g.13675  ORF Transcript_4754/g.13675 Transcript_4754/m.13675 type:complete len:790 (-) Transcript_4754:298-2667(-)